MAASSSSPGPLACGLVGMDFDDAAADYVLRPPSA